MPLFVLICTDKANSAELRAANRPAHLDYYNGKGAQVKVAGPYLDDAGDPIGSMVILEAEDRAAAEAVGAGDPYTKAGVFQSVEVRGWRAVLGSVGG